MSRIVKKGATSQSLYFSIADSASTTGGKKTGLLYNTANLVAYFTRNGENAVAITLATLAAANSAWSTGGFKEVHATNVPGLYRLDVPDAAFVAGVESVVVSISGAAGMVQTDTVVQLSGVDLMDAVRMGLTALPNAAAGASGGLPLLSAALTVAANLKEILGTALTETAGQIAAGFKKVFDVATPVFTAASVNQSGDGFARIGANGAGLTSLAQSADYTAGRAAKLDFLDVATGSRAAPGAAMTLTAGERTAIANEVEAQIIDETDSEKVLTAITDKIASVNPSLGGLTLAAIASAVWTNGSRVLTAGTNIVLAKGTGLTGLNDLDAAGVRSAIGMSLATFDAQLAALDNDVLSRLAAAAYTAPPTANQNADALFDRADAIETGLTMRQSMRGLTTFAFGKRSGSPGTPEQFRAAVSDAKVRLTYTLDVNGNRSAIVADFS